MNEIMEKKFWEFVAKRQEVWYHSKVLNRPIIDGDEILRKYRFCNVYRFLDRGTLYPIEKFICPTINLSNTDLVFKTILYRILNNPDTWEDIGQSLHDFNPDMFEYRITSLIESGRPLYDGRSYVPFSRIITATKGLSITERLVLTACRLALTIDELTKKLINEEDGQSAFNFIRHFSSDVRIGGFCAYQILIDLTYQRTNDKPLSPIDTSKWVHSGPGSKNGAKLLGINNPFKAMKILHKSQPHWLPFPIGNFNEQIELSFPNLEHSLCEFFKYQRIKDGGFKRPYAKLGTRWQPEKPYPPWLSGRMHGYG